MKHTLSILGLLAGLCGQMSATPLVPGTPAMPVGPYVTPSLTTAKPQSNNLLDSVFENWNTVNPVTKTKSKGTFKSAVYSESVTGYLDFYYQISVTSGDAIAQVSMEDFGMFAADASYLTTTQAGAFFTAAGPGQTVTFSGPTGKNPLKANEVYNTNPDQDGNPDDAETVNFYYYNAPAAPDNSCSTCVQPGTNSAVMLIRTNATHYDNGLACGSIRQANKSCGVNLALDSNGGGTWVEGAFEPSLTPEPAFYGLMTLGVCALLGIVRFRSRKTASTIDA